MIITVFMENYYLNILGWIHLSLYGTKYIAGVMIICLIIDFMHSFHYMIVRKEHHVVWKLTIISPVRDAIKDS